KVRRFCRDHEKSPDQEKKQQDDNARPDKSQFLTDNREDHIILRLRQKPQFLYAVPQPPPEQAAASDRIQPLKRLIAFLILLRITPDCKALQPVALHSKKYGHKRDPRCPHPD